MMSFCNYLSVITLASAVSLLGSIAHAQSGGHQGHGGSAPATAAAATPSAAAMAEGEVRRIDRGTARITIRHGDIPNLDMPPMTMVFQAQPASLAENLKVGDRVRFRADKVGGTYVVTAIEPLR